MYQNIFFNRDTRKLHIFDDKKGHSESDYSNYAYLKSPNGKYVSLYGDTCQRVTYWTDEDVKKGLILESDVPIETKALIDMYRDDDNISINHREMIFDIEVEVTKGMPNIQQAKNKITSIAYYDKSKNEYHLLVLDPSGSVKTAQRKNPTINEHVVNKLFINSFKTETELLISFVEHYVDMNPTILSGWNIEGFDIPYLYHRLLNVLGQSAARKLSPINNVKWSERRQRYVIAGVSILDYIALYKKFTYSEEPSYRLDAIGKKRVKIGKVEYEGTLDMLFKNDIEKFIEYNLNDVLIVVKLDEKYKFIDLVKGIGHKCHVPYEDVYMSSRFLEGAILTYMRRNNIICPNKKKIDITYESLCVHPRRNLTFKVRSIHKLTPIVGTLESERTVGGEKIKFKYKDVDFDKCEFVLEEPLEHELRDTDLFKLSFPGAFVKEPNPGRYAWIYDLDATAMYPRNIMSLNISPETKLGRIVDWDVMDYIHNKSRRYKLVDTNNPRVQRELTRGEIKNLLGDDDLKISIAPNGTLYKMNQKGLIPTILEIWAQERTDYRILEKKYGTEDSPDYDEEKHQFYKRLQSIQKVMLNSMYGCLGLVSFRFFDIDNAEAVTMTGVHMIQFAQKMVNHYYNTELQLSGDEDHVIYVDTDSMFISAIPLLDSRYPDLNYDNFEEVSNVVLEIVDEVQDYVNKSFDVFAKKFLNLDTHMFQVKQEIIAESGFWVTKKRYALNKFKENGLLVPSDERREIKGLDVKKSNFPIAFRDIMFVVLDLILELQGKQFKNTKEEIDSEILSFKKKIKDFDILEIASPTSCKGMKKYSTVEKSDFKIKKTLFTDRAKGCPAHVRSALNYNDFLKYYKIDKKYELIQEGSKIKWIYLKNNEFSIKTIAMKGYDDPKKVMDFINQYIDYEEIFASVLLKKLSDFYTALKWGQVANTSTQTMKKFFKL